MSKLFINDTTLTAIGSAIREKTGKSDLIAPLDMPDEIRSIETSGGGAELPEEAFTFTGNVEGMFAYGNWTWFIDTYGNKIKTVDINNAENFFAYNTKIKKIPFTINLASSGMDSAALTGTFQGCSMLEEVPYIDGSKMTPPTGAYINNMSPSAIFNGANRIRQIPNDYFTRMATDTYWKEAQKYTANRGNMFANCYSLREIPDIRQVWNSATNAYGNIYYNMLGGCYSLNKATLPTSRGAALTSNMFTSMLNNCFRLKDLLFDVDENNNPYEVSWKSQIIDLVNSVGYGNVISNITGYNSGITEDKRVLDDATYQALKNDEDWFTTALDYSRYNRTSAVNTINSLPDTSAYLATAGGTNTIKFKGASGALTDGGAINTMTEEEIAVAAAKGWTVSFV